MSDFWKWFEQFSSSGWWSSFRWGWMWWFWWNWWQDASFKERMKHNLSVISTSLIHFVFTIVLIEIALIIITYSSPTFYDNLIAWINRFTIYIFMFVYQVFIKWMSQLQLSFIEKYGWLSLIAFIYLSWNVIWQWWFWIWDSADFTYRFVHWILWAEWIIFALWWLLLLFIVYLIWQFKDIVNFLQTSGILDKIMASFWKSKPVEQEEQVVEEKPKPKWTREKLIEFTNNQLQAAWFRTSINWQSSWAEAIDYMEGINWFMVFIDPKGKNFNELLNFCSSTLWEKSHRFETEAEETQKDWKRVILATFSSPVNFADPNFMKNKFDKFKKYAKWLNFLQAVKTTPEIKEWFNKNPEMIYFWVDRMGKPLFTEFNEAPHFLITWETKWGKSVLMHNMIMSPMLKMPPSQLQIALVDPKDWVEFWFYQPSPYFQKYPLAKNQLEGIGTIWLVFKEYKRRIDILKKYKVRKMTDIPREKWEEEGLHFIIIMIDEYFVLRFEWDKNKWELINAKLSSAAALMRFAGINIILATQNAWWVIDWWLKANLPLKISLRMNDWRSYMSTFWISPWKVALQWFWDWLFYKWGQMIRFQWASLSNDDIMWLINEHIRKYPDAYYTPDEERNKKFVEWLKYLESTKNEKSDLQAMFDEEMEWSWIQQDSKKQEWIAAIWEKDFASISDNVLEAINDLKEMNLWWYVNDKNKSLVYMDQSSLKMISYIFEHWKFEKWLFRLFPSISNKEYNNFRNFLIHSWTVTVVWWTWDKEQDLNLMLEPKQDLILTEDASDISSFFILLWQYIEKTTWKSLLETK